MSTEISTKVWPFLTEGAMSELLRKQFRTLSGVRKEGGVFMRGGRRVTDAEVLALVFDELTGDTLARFQAMFERVELVLKTPIPVTAETAGHPPDWLQPEDEADDTFGHFLDGSD